MTEHEQEVYLQAWTCVQAARGVHYQDRQDLVHDCWLAAMTSKRPVSASIRRTINKYQAAHSRSRTSARPAVTHTVDNRTLLDYIDSSKKKICRAFGLDCRGRRNRWR